MRIRANKVSNLPAYASTRGIHEMDVTNSSGRTYTFVTSTYHVLIEYGVTVDELGYIWHGLLSLHGWFRTLQKMGIKDPTSDLQKDNDWVRYGLKHLLHLKV